MTTYTISTDTNWHSLTARAGGDTYNIQSGATLTIDGDTRYGPNTTAATGVLGSITINSTSGGKLSITSAGVRLIPFAGGSGNVPAADTVISQGTASGKLLGVWSALNTTPTAAGSAMPTSGFIKIRQTVGSFAAGVLTGISATAIRADIAGWIEVVGAEGGKLGINRKGSLEIKGDWFIATNASGDSITVSGNRGQQVQLPGSVQGVTYPAIWIETSAGSNTWEIWPNAKNLVNSQTATDSRAQIVWISDNGLVTIGSDGVNSVGMLPPTGARIRVPNVFLHCSNTTVGYSNNVVPNSTLASRFTNNTSNDTLVVDCCNAAWYFTASAANKLSISNSSIFDGIGSITYVAEPITILNCCIVPYISQTTILSISSPISGAVVSDCVVARYLIAAFNCVTLSGNSISFIRNRVVQLGAATAAGAVGVDVSGAECLLDSNSVIGFPMAINQSGGYSLVVTNTKYSSTFYGTTSSAFSSYVFGSLRGGAVVDGLSWVTDTQNACHPYTSIFSNIVQANGVRIRRIGEYSNPISLGSLNQTGSVCAWGISSQCVGGSIKKVYFTQPRTSLALEIGVTSKDIVVESVGYPGNNNVITFNGDMCAIKGIMSSRPSSDRGFGAHWFDRFQSTNVGEIAVIANAPTIRSGGQCAISNGTPVFNIINGAGTLQFNTVGDSVQWEQAYFAQGHTGFTGFSLTGTNTANLLAEYQINTGSGWSAWKTANTANLTVETINPTTGVKLRLRLTLTTGTASITFAAFATTATSASIAAINYPLDPAIITVNGLVTESIVKVTRTDTGAVLFVGSESGGQVSFTADYSGQIAVEARKASSAPYYLPWTALATVSGDTTLTALQVRDDA